MAQQTRRSSFSTFAFVCGRPDIGRFNSSAQLRIPVTIVWISVAAIATQLLTRLSNLRWWSIGLVSLSICLFAEILTITAIENLI